MATRAPKRRLILSDDEEDEQEEATAVDPLGISALMEDEEDEEDEDDDVDEEVNLDDELDSEEDAEIEQHLRMVEALAEAEEKEKEKETEPETRLLPSTKLSPEAREAFNKLKPEQQKVINLALERKCDGKGYAGRYRRNICILGEAGTGKSHLLRTLLLILEERTRAESENKGFVVMSATTQIVARDYNANNINKVFGFRVYWCETKKKAVRTGKPILKFLKEDWGNVHSLIVDEISMLSMYMLDIMDETLQLAKSNKLPMGGIQIIFCGDFKQLPPVNIRKSCSAAEYAFLSPVWRRLFEQPMGCLTVLRQNHRQKSDPQFLRLLRAVRNNSCTPEDYALLMSLVKPQQPNSTMVCPRNKQADAQNDKVIASLPGDLETLTGELYDVRSNGKKSTSVKRARFDLGSRDGYKTADDLRAKCKVPYRFNIKAGSRIFLAVNHDKLSWCVNGAPGTFLGFKESKDDVMLLHLDGEPDDMVHELMCFPFRMDESDKKTSWVEFEQFPILRGYAMSIHGAQGMTLVLVHVGSDSWAPYMLYVALSRGTHLGGITLQSFRESDIKVDPVVEQFYRDQGIVGA
jgi:hypothetical protein